ncbi:MAG TPA: SgcJ/EcaC family oxidoreductase [Sphingomicrobium sp.]|nr:SgcJ/EcaC family oxidoreductase [Sphingomicrobium sp.]
MSNYDEDLIRKLVDRWMEASRRGDIGAVLDLMSKDVMFIVPGREPFGRDEFEAMSQAMSDSEVEGRAEIRELRLLGDWAWIRNYIEVTVTPRDGEPVHRSGYTLSILKKGPDGKWRLERDANLVT